MLHSDVLSTCAIQLTTLTIQVSERIILAKSTTNAQTTRILERLLDDVDEAHLEVLVRHEVEFEGGDVVVSTFFHCDVLRCEGFR